MTNYIEAVKEMLEAWDNKDEAKIRSYLHEDYSFKGPMMEANNPDECIELMLSCPFGGKSKTTDIIVDGHKVVHAFDWTVTAPFEASIPMVEIMTFVDGKVKSSQMYYDTGLFPKDVMEQMQEENKAA